MFLYNPRKEFESARSASSAAVHTKKMDCFAYARKFDWLILLTF